MSMTFEEMYNSKAGILGMSQYDEVEEFESDLKELENNLDFTFVGHFDMTQDADEELQYQGLSLDEITKASLNRYGSIIETLQAPDSGTYWVFIGTR